MSPAALLRTLQEMESRQIELERQNEELRRSIRELEPARARILGLCDLSPAALLAVSRQGLIVEANRAAEAVFGIPRHILLMSPIAQYIPPDDHDALERYQHDLLVSGGTRNWDVSPRRQDGTNPRLRFSCSFLEGTDTFLMRLALPTGISESRSHHDGAAGLADIKTRLVDSMQEGVAVLGLNGSIIDVNPAFLRMTGFLKEELVGLPPPRPYWPPEERLRIQAAIEESVTNPEAAFELVFMRKNGQRFPVIVTSMILRGPNGEAIGYAATVRDATSDPIGERTLRKWNRRLELRVGERTAQLQQTRARLRLLAGATFEGIVVTQDGIILDANPQFATFCGCELNDLIGRDIIQFVAPESQSLVASRISQGIEGAYEFVAMRSDGRRFPAEANAAKKTWQGRVTRITAVRDLSERKAAKAKLDALSADLEQALRLALLGEISMGIVHQIAQPLTNIGMRLLIAKTSVETCHGAACGPLAAFHEVESDVARIRDVTNHLRALANPERPNRESVAINALVRECGRLLESEVEKRGAGIRFDLDESIPELPADSIQLSQVVINLLRNALEAGDGLPPERRSVDLKTRKLPGEGVEIRISDLGVGIPPEAMDRLFSPFFTTKPNGLGIGLRLSRTIIRAHGGRIECAANRPGPGATFTVVLPTQEGCYPKVQ